jgi:hypothetical protein
MNDIESMQTEAKCAGYTRVNDGIVILHYVEPEHEPEYECNDDCWLYGREDESDGFFPCSHCYRITRDGGGA